MRPAILDPNYQGPFGNTLLHGAVLINDRTEVERLLAAGADPRIPNREGRTPIQVAVLLGHPGLYALLAQEHLEQLLDQALEATFPASDPVAITPGSRTRL
jgi:ankyrin repeat protein